LLIDRATPRHSTDGAQPKAIPSSYSMKLRRSMSATLANLTSLSLLAACSGNAAPAPTNTAGVPAAGTSPAPGGSGGSGGSGGLGVAGGGSGAPAAGASGTGSTIPPTFETVKLVLGGGGPITPCFAAPCHGVGGAAPPTKPLELPPNNDKQLHTNLTSYVSAACGNTKLVTPGNPAQSALVTILTGPCGMTPRMPYGCSADAGDCIPDEYIAAVKQWIANGAPQ
jgi:hypothetical protein